ncbi:MAG: NADPH-dependent glutamate synthase, partial [Bacillota bacterium]
VGGCPVQVPIPDFVAAIVRNDFQAAHHIITTSNNLPAICGRVCPQERQCEGRCILGRMGQPLAVGALERFAADWQAAQPANEEAQQTVPTPNGLKVAVVGSGPAGLSCAADLAKLGYEVSVFEALHEPGGILTYGIPEFRLPKSVVRREINALVAMGVKIKTNMVIGSILDLEDLKADGYAAVFLAGGAGLPSFMGIPGEGLNGVYAANEFLTRVNLMKAGREGDTPIFVGKHVAVIGGGNVAMDAARTARRLGSEVTIIYRRGRDEMPARLEEIEHALAEGVQLAELHGPTAMVGNEAGWVTAVRCERMALGEPDSSGRRRPVAVPGSEYDLASDTVVVAIGQSPNPLLMRAIPELAVAKRGHLQVEEESGATNLPGVFAGGDLATGAASVIAAMGAGKRAAAAIHREVSEKGKLL